MKNIFLSSALIAAASLSTASAATLASDNAADSAYSDGWTTGDNGGTGFGAWALSTNGTAANTRQILGDSVDLVPGSPGTGPDINTSGVSFAMGGFGVGTSAISTRSLTGDLSIGQTFSITLAVNFRNGSKGFSMLDGGGEIFKLDVASDKYTVSGATTGNGDLFSNTYNSRTVFTISLTQTAANTGDWSVVRSGGLTGTANGTYTGTPDQFQLFVGGTTGSAIKTQDYLYANSISVVPEPGSAMLLLVGVGALLARRSRR